MAQNPTHTVRGGGTKPERYWDTVETIAEAWKKANPDDRRSLDQIGQWIIDTNDIKTTGGRDCRFKLDVAIIRKGQELTLPKGNALGDFDVVKEVNCKELPPEEAILLFTTPESVATTEPGRPAGVAAVKLPDYLNAGTLNTKGSTAEVYDGWNLPMMLGIMPDQPDPAARGVNRNGTGVQTVVTSFAHSATYLAAITPIPVASNVGLVYLPTFMVSGYKSADRAIDAGQGGNGAQNYERNASDTPGRDIRFDGWPLNGKPLMPFALSERGFRDATLLPGLGVQLNGENRIANADGTVFGNNQIYNVVGQNGAFTPSVTPSRIEQESGGKKKNRFTQGEAGKPEPLNSMNNYALAYFVNEQSIQPQVSIALAKFEKLPNQADAQRAIELLNYQNDLVGVSNFNVNADVRKIARGDAPTAETLLALNPAERISFQKESVIFQAEKAGITGLNPNAKPAQSPVQSITREELRGNLINYYDTMAEKKGLEFSAVYSRQVNEDAKYDSKDPESRRAAATTFVDTLPILATMPAQGFGYDHLENYFQAPREQFNDVEKYIYRPKSTEGLTRADTTAAIDVLASDPGSVALLLEGSKNTDVAQAWISFDDKRVQLPKLFGDKRIHWDRAELLRETKERGYSDARIDFGGKDGEGNFSREETRGKIVGNVSDIQPELVASAADPDVVKRRQQDLRDMARNDGMWAIGKGAPANQLLYALAKEPDNKTLYAIEARIRANAASPEIADQQIETLRKGVEYAKDTISKDMLGTDVDTIARANARRSMMSPGVAAAQGTEGRTETETRTDSVIVEGNVKTLFGHLATKPAAAQAFVAAAGGEGETQRSALLKSALTLPADQQLLVAKAAIGANPTAAAALIPEADKAAFSAATGALTADNAGSVLTILSNAPLASAGAVSAIAKDAKASTAVMTALSGDKTTASLLASGLNAPQQTDIAKKANLNPNQADLWTSVAPKEVTNTVTRTVPVTNLQLEGDTGLAAFREAGLEPDARARKVKFSKAYITDSVTQERSIAEMAVTRPDIMTAAVIQTLSDNPELVGGMRSNLEQIGDKRANRGITGAVVDKFTTNAQEKLGDIIGDLVKAQQTNNPKEIARATQRLNEMAASNNPAEQQAFADLVAATMATEPKKGSKTTTTGRDALVSTLTTALDNSLSNTQAPLRSSQMTADDLLNGIYTTVPGVDYSNARQLVDSGLTAINSNTSTSGWIIPFIPVVKGTDKPKNDPKVPCTPGIDGCPEVPRPPPPVFPPTQPPPQIG